MNGVNDKDSAISAKRIVLVGFDGVEPLDIAGPASVFARAERLQPGSYILEQASRSGGSLATATGLTLSGVTPLSSRCGPIDTLLVAGGSEAALREAVDEGLAATVARMAADIRRVGSICTGAFVLAAAGLLDGRRATTHWAACDALARLFPAVRVEPDSIYVADPPIFTSAGVSAGIDLALALVEADLGHATASRIAREMVLFLRRPGGQSQYSATLQSQSQAAGEMGALIAWISENLSADLRIPALADRAMMSERTFVRLFKKQTGLTPAVLVRRLRVERAKLWLETTDWPVPDIALRAGFGSEDSLTRTLREVYGTVPSVLRAGFGRRD